MNDHFCQNEHTGTSFFISFGDCCSDTNSGDCCSKKMQCSDEEHEDNDNCCHNTPSFQKLEQNQILRIAESEVSEKNHDSPVLYFSNQIQLPAIDPVTSHDFKYIEPLIVFDFQVRLETFLC